ncbi:unnamed protein product (macronuclear) [Paramecium tetraurelia]|uniref:TATA-binding protein interacting (TIP20) domain-containing protein n=1 Tax=Paramecium tetraurelia TaxID=5888 RepID=A0CZJ2_PARTE|nr:uncharacterized protein GSPATT00011782001 [Paramecium tetraurelia]CAK76209.1 unnamed protein product [Paramecium tetraurelia]|eukprot:XP_001443606.1 hypothetical protein (macronuclear) [Paramecium tetraurelia strain d4-2]
MDQKKIESLINEALKNPDPDIQYMRAEELTNELTIFYGKQEQNEKNQNIINECYNVFYQHLSSQYREIQGNAIRQFQRLSPLMRSQEVQYIAQELLKSSTQGMNDTRENYHICLQEIVEKIPIQVQSLFEVQEGIVKKLRESKETVKKLQVSNQIVHQEIQQNVEIQAELLKILSSIMSRWPKLYQKDFSDLLLDNITNSNELSIRKNSCVCLGYLGVSLSQQSLNDLIQNRILPLVKELRFDQQSFAKILYLNQSLNHLAKSSGKYFEKALVEQIFERFFQIQKEQQKIDLDNINQYAEILEIQLLTINYLLSNNYARAFDQKLIDQITPLIDFDPLGVAAIEENPYDDDYYIDETSDSTWRVRRCALYTFQELLKIQPQQYKVILSALFGPNQIIMNRINEKNAEIKLSIVQFLISLVQASAVTNEELNPEDELQQLSLLKQRSIPPSISLIELVEQLLDKVSLIFQDAQEQQSLKSESTKLLLAIGQYFHSQIQKSQLCFSKIVEIIKQSIDGSSVNYSNEQKLASILTMKSILKITEPAAFQVPILKSMVQVLIEAVNQKYIRIQIEGYSTLEILVFVFKQNYQEQFQDSLSKIKQTLIIKIQVDTLDQEVKQSLFSLATSLFKYFPSIYTKTEVEQLAQTSLLRLQIEALTNNIMTLVQYFKNLNDPKILISSIANHLQKNDKSQTYLALINLIQNNKIDQNLATDILSRFKQITTENYDLQILTLQVLIKVTNIKLPDSLIKETVKIGLQQTKIKPEIEDFFNLVNQKNLIEQEITKQLGKEELYPAGQIYCSILKNVPGSLSSLYSSLTTNRQLKLSTLRFLHKYQKDQKALDILCQLIKDNQDSDLAAFVIGSAVTDFQQIQKLIDQNPNQYQFYQALKEFTEITQINNPTEIAQYMLNQVDGKDKTISTICGDILGGFFKQNYTQLEQLLFYSIQSASQAIRYSCIQSLKYTHQWTNKAHILLEMLQKEKDIQILTGIIKALTQNIQHIKLNNLTQYLTFCLRRYEEKELNFGNFVEKRDDAKDLRSLSFDLLESFLSIQNVELKPILVEVFDKFADDKYEETRIPRLRIIQKIIKSNPLELVPYLEILLKTFEPILKTLQQQLQKQDQNLDKEKEKFRLIISILQGLRLNSKEVDSFCGKCLTEQILKSVGQ